MEDETQVSPHILKIIVNAVQYNASDTRMQSMAVNPPSGNISKYKLNVALWGNKSKSIVINYPG